MKKLKARGIIIFGSPGSGKTTFGKILAKYLNANFFDLDDYIWKKTKIPFTEMYSHEDKIKRLENDIEKCLYFVMAGSMDSFNHPFVPLFDLAIFLNVSKDVRLKRINEREQKRFGERINENGDMYQNHQAFFWQVINYDNEEVKDKCSPNLTTHLTWAKTLPCKVHYLDGSKSIAESLSIIIKDLPKPTLYEPSTAKFWDDEHISKMMLEAHLNKNWDAASRKYDFMIESSKWIKSLCNINQSRLLDLGCGPGLYDALFDQLGFEVTGIDFSKRSIDYAKNQAILCNQDIKYYYQNYLDINYNKEFDVITLIYCDFGVLSDNDQKTLLKKIYQALDNKGIFIFDVWTRNCKNTFSEGIRVNHYNNGFFS